MMTLARGVRGTNWPRQSVMFISAGRIAQECSGNYFSTMGLNLQSAAQCNNARRDNERRKCRNSVITRVGKYSFGRGNVRHGVT